MKNKTFHSETVSDPVFISVAEACKRFGYSRGAVYALINNEKVAHKKITDKIYVNASDVADRYEAQKERIGKKRNGRKFQKVKPSVPNNREKVVYKVVANPIETVVIILAGITGVALGYIISLFLK